MDKPASLPPYRGDRLSESSHEMPAPALHPAVPGKLHRLNAGPCRSAGSSGPARRIGHGQACLCRASWADRLFRELPWNARTGAPSCRPGETASPERRTVQKRREQWASAPDRSWISLPLSRPIEATGLSESSHEMPAPALHPAVPGKLHRLNAGPCRSTGSSGPARRIGHGQALPLPRPMGPTGFSESSHGMPEPALHPAVPGKLHRLNAGPCRSTGSSGPARRIGHGQACLCSRFYRGRQAFQRAPMECQNRRSILPSRGNCTG